MIACSPASHALARAPAVAAFVAVSTVLSGCAGMSDDLTPLFANPARYELWDCKQLESERKDIARQTLEIEGLIAKAQTGVAGPLVAEMAYRNDYLALRGQAHFAEEAWRKNKCRETQPVAPAEESVSPAKSAPVSKAGKTIY